MSDSTKVVPRAVQITAIEVNGLAELGSKANAYFMDASSWNPDETEEERLRRKEEEEARAAEQEFRRQQAGTELKNEIEDRLKQAFEAGRKLASDRNTQSAWNARSIALYLVVLAVVLMPFVAIWIGLDPEAFGTYIAPVTGIAGTVVGYWFGTIERKSGGGEDSPSRL